MSNHNPSIVLAESSKASAKLFTYGNILAVIIPLPIFIFWFGASMVFYAMQRHHPNSRVGYYTQIAAYQYYALAGLLVPVFTFASVDFLKKYWAIMWGLCVVIMLPLAIIQLIRINSEEWKDVSINKK